MTTKLPNYFTSDFEGGMYYTQGDRVYGTVTQRGSVVEYRFNDGSRPYTDEIDFGTEAKAIRAASKMAAEMRRYDESVPHMGTFQAMFY
jgi:hypothetical protein